jgi:hypothetical protein
MIDLHSQVDFNTMTKPAKRQSSHSADPIWTREWHQQSTKADKAVEEDKEDTRRPQTATEHL